MAVFEEKYFQKPVVVTNIPSSLEMIEDGANGIVVKRNVDDIYRGVKMLLDDKALCERLGTTPAKGLYGNEQIMAAIEKEFEKYSK